MSDGKFSKPRPYRDEEREIEQAFRQMTGQAPPPEPDPIPGDLGPLPDDLTDLAELELDLEEAPQEPPHEGKYLEEEAPPEPDLIDQLQVWFREAAAYCGKNPRIVMVGLCAVALVIILGFMAAFFFSTSDPYGEKILDNVYLADINVGGMTKAEAVKAVNQATAHTYSQQDMVIDLAGTPLALKPRDTKVSLDVKAAVKAAYDYGRTGPREERERIYQASRTESHFIGLLPYLELDQKYIRQVLTQYAQDTGSTLTQTAYGLEGDLPELRADKFNENAPGQTLVITMGTPGVGFDPEAVFKQVLDAYSLNQFRVEVNGIASETEPDPIDLRAIYEEFYIAPVDASVDMQTFETIPGSYGYGFDLEEAMKLVAAAGYGQEVRIPMEYIEPEFLEGDMLFRDTLGAFESRHSDHRDRTANLELACRALNGLTLDPGKEFSFNDVLGKRTEDKGYRPAPSDAGPEASDTLGGGIGQVSSALYVAAMLADLSVTDRTSHSLVPSYSDYGMDAAVSWGGPDFRFRNNTNYPIKLEAEVSGGYVKVRILGTDEKDYTVRLDYSITSTNEPGTEYKDFPFDNKEGYKDGDVIREGKKGYSVKTYRLKYDKENGELLSKDFEANSRYLTVDKVIARVEPEETVPPTEAPTEPPTLPPTEPPTEAPTEPPTEAPPTEAAEPTPAPTEAPTETPTEAPTEAPASPSNGTPPDGDPPAEQDPGQENIAA